MLSFIFDTKVISAVAIGGVLFTFLLSFLWIKFIFYVPNKPIADTPVKCQSVEGYKAPVLAYVFDGPALGISGSQFSTKLTMFLRLTGIPHIVKLANYEEAPKNKTPYIEHDGSKFGDTQLIIRYLENSFDLTKMAVSVAKKNGGNAFVPYHELSPQDQALSDMIRLTAEGEVYWATYCTRWGGKFGISGKESTWLTTRDMYFQAIPAAIRNIVCDMIRVSCLRDAWGQGLIRHSPSDQFYLGSRALKSLSNFLDKKVFFLGDFPAECDCAAFGALEAFLDDAVWPSPLSTYVREKCPNLVAYVSRVRQLVFADVATSDPRPGSKEGVTALPRN